MSSKSQPSRKGKRAWRKNIDIEDIEVGLEESRVEQRTVGTSASLENTESAELFTIDTQGDDSILKKRKIKPLKAQEILARRSAVPALVAPKQKKTKKVPKKELDRLLRVAGVRDGGSAKAIYEKDGILTTPVYDAWGDDSSVAKSSVKVNTNASKLIPEITKTLIDLDYEQVSKLSKEEKKAILFHGISAKKKVVVPATMKLGPEKISETAQTPVEIPHAGKSYNPSFEEWQELLRTEYVKEKARVDKMEELETYKAKIQLLIEQLPDGDDMAVDSNAEEEEEEKEGESEEKAASSDDSVTVKSVNKPVEVKRKTQAQKNKDARKAELQRLEKQLKTVKKQLQDLHNLHQVLKEHENQVSTKTSKKDKKKKKTKLSKYDPVESQLEVKLSDELTDSLRRLKPEGDLTKDRFKTLQDRGLIEARVRVGKRRRYTPKVTEKWSYKDFK